MTRIGLLLAATTTVLMACNDASDPMGPSRARAQLSYAPGDLAVALPAVRDVKQVSSGTTEFIGWCDEAAGLVLADVPGSGTAKGVGQFRVEQTVCVNVATGQYSGGEATLIAANGDELNMTFGGTIVSPAPPLTADFVYVVTGGTGRFARAEGSIDARVVQTTPSTWESTGSGWLSYYPSDRSGR